jgi:arylsulfatase A-like enzyme
MRPEDQGFDDSLYMAGTLYLPEDSPQVVNSKQDFDPIDKMVWAAGQYAVQFNGSKSFEPNGYTTDYYTDEAIKVIEANKHRPFFLYLAHWGIHNPLQAKKEDYNALSHIKDHRLRVYAAMIRAVDRSVGRVMKALKENGIDKNTLVVFTSDNGGADYLGLPDINKPYRGWKLTLFEGGTHVPFFARWPKRIPKGLRYDKPVSHIDIFSTAAAVANAPLPTDRKIDGVNLMPYITGALKGEPHNVLFWRQGYYQGVLAKGWKMMVSDRPDKVWLYHLTKDPNEQTNLADQYPKKVAELQALLDAHNAEQAEPLWPCVIEGPIRIDKTSADPLDENDEYIYWPN